MYGSTLLGTEGFLNLILDGGSTDVPLSNGTIQSDRITPMYRANNMKDGDHQLVGRIPPLTSGGFVLDHLECVMPSIPRTMH